MKKNVWMIWMVLALLLCSCGVPADTPAENVDVDLTTLSSTMVYSQVSDMVQNPTQYIGKTVKMQGPFATMDSEGTTYFACIISDATACCAQGIEFVRKGQYEYPADYPDAGDEITVTGVFESYQEGEHTYYHLADADVVF